MKSYIYVASSWRNILQPVVVNTLRDAGMNCYDFRNPAPGVSGFAWSEIDPRWQRWTAEQYIKALDHPIAIEGYRRDFDAMQKADTFVLVLPCGRSAHLELGWAVGVGKRTAILTSDGEEPELMAKMVDHIATSMFDLLQWLQHTECTCECSCGCRNWIDHDSLINLCDRCRSYDRSVGLHG